MTLFAVQDGPGPRAEVAERGTYRKHSEVPRVLKRREAASIALGPGAWADKGDVKVGGGGNLGGFHLRSSQSNHQVSRWISTSRLVCVDTQRRVGRGHTHWRQGVRSPGDSIGSSRTGLQRGHTGKTQNEP